MTRVAIYARYSTDLQSATSAEDQTRLCNEYAARSGWTVIARFADEAMSGQTLDRPGLNALLAGGAGFDIVLTESLDRLSRDQSDIAMIFKRLRFAECEIHTLSSGRNSEIDIGLRGTMSALFLRDLGDKTRRGQHGVVTEGRIPGGLSYGYRKALVLDARGEPVRGHRSIDATEADVVRRIFRAFADGQSPRAIACALNAEGVASPGGTDWRGNTIFGSRARANGILNNRLYAGTVTFNRQRFVRDPESRKRIARANDVDQWRTVDVPALRIVDEALWDAVAKRLDRCGDTAPAPQRRPKRLLSGLIRCGVCGGPVVIIGTDSWGCSRRRESNSCDNSRTIMTAPLERRVIGALRDQLLAPECVRAYSAAYRHAMELREKSRVGDRVPLERRLREADARCKRLALAIAEGAGSFDDIRDLLRRASVDRDAARAAIAAAERPSPTQLHPDAPARYRTAIATLETSLTPSTPEMIDARAKFRTMIGAVFASPHESGRGLALNIRATLDPDQTQKSPLQAAEGDPMFSADNWVAGTGFGCWQGFVKLAA